MESSMRILHWTGWSWFHELFLFFGLIWITVIGALQLDHHLSSWNTGAALIPTLIGALPLITSSVAYLVISKCYEKEGTKFEPFNRCLDSNEACVFISLCGITSYFEYGHYFVSASTSCFASWLFLFTIRLSTASTSLKWIIVFLPLWIWSLLMISGIILEYMNSNQHYRTPISTIVFVIIGALLAGIFFVLISLQLDHNADMSWHGVFTPLYLLNFYFLLVTGVFLESMRGNFTFGYKGTSKRWLCGLLPVAFLLTPLLVFEIMLAERLDENTDIPFIVVAVPMLVFEGLLTVCCMGASIYKCCSS